MKPNIAVIDIFCGAGGLSLGLKNVGLNVVMGVDADEDCQFPFEENIVDNFHQKDIALVTGEELRDAFGDADVKVLVGCAPCQPFSLHTQKGKGEDDRWKLLEEFMRLIEECEPDIVSMENVPQLRNFNDGKLFSGFVDGLEEQGFSTWSDVVYCPQYGLPQNRKRLVFLATKKGEIKLIPPTHKEKDYVTVEQAIGKLPKLAAGERDGKDKLHRTASLSDINQRRMLASKPKGTWRDWPEELLPDCYKRETGQSYCSVYGRMAWDEPSPTITTQFYGYGTGRFGHPTQTRALSLREGAILQSFPEDYKFCSEGAAVTNKRIGKLIGNAVPVKLGEAIGKSIKSHLTQV